MSKKYYALYIRSVEKYILRAGVAALPALRFSLACTWTSDYTVQKQQNVVFTLRSALHTLSVLSQVTVMQHDGQYAHHCEVLGVVDESGAVVLGFRIFETLSVDPTAEQPTPF